MDKRKKILMIAAIILAAMMVVPMLFSAIAGFFPSAAAAVTQSDINKLKNEAKEIASKKENLNSELAKLKRERSDALAQKAVYDSQIETLNAEITTIGALIAGLETSIAERNRALDTAIAAQADLKARFEARIAGMQKMGNTSYLGVLLEAESISDFLLCWEAMAKLIDYDNNLAEEYRKTCADIAVERQALEDDRAEQVRCRETLTASQVELADLSKEADALIAEIQNGIAEGQKQLDAQDAAEREAQKEIAALQAEWKKQQEAAKKNTEYVGGQYMWPVPGHTYVSSPFGNRIHPIYKVTRFHSGIDIPAPKNTPVVAANAGTVITRNYNSGYGNYVVVDHGGGQATLYAHLNSFGSYGVGSSVKRGDTIAYVGTTGVSTGNHLHFEIIIGGSQVNPIPYLKG